ncbi:MAG TPA: thioredoxin family protein [Roseiarcus sp.]|jgi:thiol-disulfide isomerase/thioredoxin
MLSRRSLLAAIAAVSVGAPAFAAAPVDYSPAAFDAALKSGKPVLVWIHASWCPTCKAQAPTLARIEADPRYKDLTVVRVDFDSQKDAVKRFGARMQSTLITFKDGKEVGRSVGETDPTALTALVAKVV